MHTFQKLLKTHRYNEVCISGAEANPVRLGGKPLIETHLLAVVIFTKAFS